MDTIDTTSLTHKTLQHLRQADTMPLAQLCKQVQRENYHEWRAWEGKQDFSHVMEHRYHTQVKDNGFALTSDNAEPARLTPIADYWTVRLAHSPTRKKECPMDLLKLTISKDALIPRDTLHSLLTEPVRALLPQERNIADNVRLALSYRLRPWQRFEHNGQTCRAIVATTKGSKGLDIWVHVQKRSKNSVEYSPDPVCQLSGNGSSQAVQVTISKEGYEYLDLLNSIGNAGSLTTFGSTHYFESDLRKLAQTMLEDTCLPLWPGIMLALTTEAHETANRVQTLLGALIAGQGKVSLMSLDNTPANREALARELAEGFTGALEKLTERCGYPAPMWESIQADYDALASKIALAESVLGVEIDCLDAQVACELALSAAQAA